MELVPHPLNWQLHRDTLKLSSRSPLALYCAVVMPVPATPPATPPRLLLEQGASTTIPDSNGRLLNCMSFAGTQFLLETHRKKRCRSIVDSLRSNSALKAFRVSWQGPSDFNLYASNGDNMLMVAAQYSHPEVLQFLIEQAAAVKPSMLMSSDEAPLLLRLGNTPAHGSLNEV